MVARTTQVPTVPNNQGQSWMSATPVRIESVCKKHSYNSEAPRKDVFKTSREMATTGQEEVANVVQSTFRMLYVNVTLQVPLFQ